jgi:hypothetical protein
MDKGKEEDEALRYEINHSPLHFNEIFTLANLIN